MTLCSTNLGSVPFLGHTDNNRLQMAAKQLNQALTNPRCEIPKVIGHDFRLLSDTSRMFKEVAPCNGTILHVNDDIMIVIFNSQVYGSMVEVYQVPSVLQCTGLYATRLRYKRDVGNFQTGDILYEYDCFQNGIPTYGYNLWTAYMPFFGLNHEDSIVISEDVANLCRATKCQQILIPIYSYSLFKYIYDDPNSFGFIPNIGQKIKGTTVALKSIPDKVKNPVQVLKSLNLTSFTNLMDYTKNYNAVPISARLSDATVTELRIHMIDKNNNAMLDKNLQYIIDQIRSQYSGYLSTSLLGLDDKIPKDFKEQLVQQHYIVGQKKRIRFEGFDYNNLMYIIELKLVSENTTHLGDKFANRYAAKGVCSLILPNDLRPYILETKQPIDLFQGPLSIISRMNFGQILEGIIAKAIWHSELEIKSDSSKIFDNLIKISKIANILNDQEYSNQIKELAYDIKLNNNTKQRFLNSVNNIGLYFEAPNFANISLKKLNNLIAKEYNIKSNETIVIPRKTINYIMDTFEINESRPLKDQYIPNIFVAPIYTIKLKQESHSKIASRDLGSYKLTSRQPIQGKDKNGIIGGGSRVGSMEFDGMLAHAVPRAIKELRTVKNDSHVLKLDLIIQMLTQGYYNMPETKQTTSYTKMMIDSLIEFIND